jgi:hypothetical protein
LREREELNRPHILGLWSSLGGAAPELSVLITGSANPQMEEEPARSPELVRHCRDVGGDAVRQDPVATPPPQHPWPTSPLLDPYMHVVYLGQQKERSAHVIKKANNKLESYLLKPSSTTANLISIG